MSILLIKTIKTVLIFIFTLHCFTHNRVKRHGCIFYFQPFIHCTAAFVIDIKKRIGDFMTDFFDQAISGYVEYVLRLLISVACGFVIGYERKNRNKEAGIRTHVIVTVASCLMMMVSKYGFGDLDAARFDGSRIASQIVSGIGFLGAGMIFVHKNSIKGLTTAAGIWATSGIGMAIGAGMYFVGIVTTVLVVLLQVFLHFNLKALRHGSTSEYVIRLKNGVGAVDIVKSVLAESGIASELISVSKKEDGIRVIIEITYPDNDALYRFIRAALNVPEILEVYAD